ncbi:ABC transporter substrate-binding protein [Marinomonas pollencensis]|uniref:Taurine transport system substrate-binding protein n=1 Tax=Marinomonas pollencensis TaxID=491954 RepID=A0A3E0DRZ1_9GAMM|nr:ABC transporter substrate-binding protein [Marinomonas pollencensis]REG85901.1 taurine transport system substrate-binding protein [Marinomonas pollencensis]
MKKIVSTLISTLAVGTVASSACLALAADKPNKVSIGYFLEWPTANQVAQVNDTYSKEMGVEVEWHAFDSGTAMSAAMASGGVDMAYSQGLVPFTIAVSKGLPITMVGIAVSYAENDNCVVGKDAHITSANAKQLEGKNIAVPFGTVSHYKMLKTLKQLEVNSKKVHLLDMAPADGAAALARGDVSMACGWGGALRRMKQYGEVLMSAKEQEAAGIRSFDVISVNNSFAKQYPELVSEFLQVTNDANKAYKESPQTQQPIIAKASGLSLTDTNQILDLFTFPVKDEQVSPYWMGGGVQTFTKEVADFFVQQKQIPKALADYSATIDASYFKNVH